MRNEKTKKNKGKETQDGKTLWHLTHNATVPNYPMKQRNNDTKRLTSRRFVTRKTKPPLLHFLRPRGAHFERSVILGVVCWLWKDITRFLPAPLPSCQEEGMVRGGIGRRGYIYADNASVKPLTFVINCFLRQEWNKRDSHFPSEIYGTIIWLLSLNLHFISHSSVIIQPRPSHRTDKQHITIINMTIKVFLSSSSIQVN